MTIATRLLIVVGIVAFMGATNTITAQSQFPPLTPDEIEDAIDFGIEGEPEPYLIRGNTVGVAEEHARHGFGLLFTPFLRVQFLSHATWWRTGLSLTPDQILPAVLAPVIHIATWLHPNPPDLPCQQEHPPRFRVYGPGSLRVVGGPISDTPAMEWAPSVSPRWAKRGLDTLAAYGGSTADTCGVRNTNSVELD